MIAFFIGINFAMIQLYLRLFFSIFIVFLASCEQSPSNDALLKFKLAGENYLLENISKENVVQTESGLQYKVLTKGQGESPTIKDKVIAHYEGKLIDGKVFDSSYERGKPLNIPLNRVIKGWTEGLQLMQVGATYEFYIPYYLAYGEKGTRGIPPYATLIFKVELISIE